MVRYELDTRIDLMLDGVMGVADYQCRQILSQNYHRLAPVFPADIVIPLDGVKRIPELIAFAQGVDIDPAVEWLERVWCGGLLVVIHIVALSGQVV